MSKTVRFTQKITTGELPPQSEETDKSTAELQGKYDQLLFILQTFACSTIGSVLVALLFVSPWSAFLLLPPCAALSLFLWFHFQKGA